MRYMFDFEQHACPSRGCAFCCTLMENRLLNFWIALSMLGPACLCRPMDIMCCIGAPFALASGTTKPEPPSEVALALFGCEVARAVGGCKPPAVLGVDMV